MRSCFFSCLPVRMGGRFPVLGRLAFRKCVSGEAWCLMLLCSRRGRCRLRRGGRIFWCVCRAVCISGRLLEGSFFWGGGMLLGRGCCCGACRGRGENLGCLRGRCRFLGLGWSGLFLRSSRGYVWASSFCFRLLRPSYLWWSAVCWWLEGARSGCLRRSGVFRWRRGPLFFCFLFLTCLLRGLCSGVILLRFRPVG